MPRRSFNPRQRPHAALHALGKKGRRETEIELQRERSHTPQAKSSRHVVPTTFSTTQWTKRKKNCTLFFSTPEFLQFEL